MRDSNRRCPSLHTISTASSIANRAMVLYCSSCLATPPPRLAMPANSTTSACITTWLPWTSKAQASRSAWRSFRTTGGSRARTSAAALIDHLGYPSCLAVGTSGGAIVALLMAILYPQKVQAVIADSTVEHFPAPTLSREVQQRSQETPDQTRVLAMGAGRRLAHGGPGELGLPAAVRTGWRRLFSRPACGHPLPGSADRQHGRHKSAASRGAGLEDGRANTQQPAGFGSVRGPSVDVEPAR